MQYTPGVCEQKPIKVWISDVLETNILGHAMVYVNNKDMPEVELDIATNVYSTLQTNSLCCI
jgi:hypothetical protein